MCKVYAFPVKKKLPEELEERLDKVTKEYVDVMTDILEALCEDNPTEKDYENFMELMMTAYAKCIEKAIDEME